MAKLIIEVVAGLIPNEPMSEYTRRWQWTGEEQEALAKGDPEAIKQWVRIAGESREYAATLENPAKVNWVRRDWLWL